MLRLELLYPQIRCLLHFFRGARSSFLLRCNVLARLLLERSLVVTPHGRERSVVPRLLLRQKRIELAHFHRRARNALLLYSVLVCFLLQRCLAIASHCREGSVVL